MREVVVITTGGTIASTSTDSGAKVAGISGDRLLDRLDLPHDISVRVVDVMQHNSYDIDFPAMDTIREAVMAGLANPATCGVVVTHGTDTMEETAMLVDLGHADARPVVFTGAQRSHDDPATDGPRNILDAIAVAAAPEAHGRGVLICFDGTVHAARGTRKVHNSDLSAFVDVDHRALGTIEPDGRLRLRADPSTRPTPILDQGTVLAGTRVDIVALYPGADHVAIDAHLASGARGLVLQATGYGNGNSQIVAAVRRAVGIPVVLSSRVAGGAIRPVYGGGGGGVDLVAAGAIPAGHLRPSQARIQLAALIASGSDIVQIRGAFDSSPPNTPDLSNSASPQRNPR